jgi:diguanylate cyclase
MFLELMSACVDGFYPLDGPLTIKAGELKEAISRNLSDGELQKVSASFLEYAKELKSKIARDYTHTNKTFLALLDRVREIEIFLSREFYGEKELDILQLETEIDQQMLHLTDGIDPTATGEEIGQILLKRTERIKKAVSAWKEKELRKVQSAEAHIRQLKQRIDETEKEAQHLSRTAREFQMKAMKDGLTGLYNRAAFDIQLKDAMDAFQRHQQMFCVVLLDVDGFKQINDSFGHVAGDRVLVEIARCLRQTFRQDDFIARYGGDEFVALIENISGDMLKKRIEHFREELRQKRFISRKKGQVIDVTVSVGTALSEPEDDVDGILERADSQMYEDKKGKLTYSTP